MQKKEYQPAEIEIVTFQTDVFLASFGGDNNLEWD